MEDYWGRYEFQHRGSIHFHGMAWLDGAPDVTLLPTMSPSEVNGVVKYFDELITTVNPGLDANGFGELPNIPANPASIPYFRVQLECKDRDYLGLILYCHTHTCRDGFCRKMVNRNLSACRFNFPFELAGQSRIDVKKDEETGVTSVAFVSKRNDPKINSHNRRIAEVHRANTDMQPVLDRSKLVGYCTKYVCKTECASDGMKHFTAQALAVTNPMDPVRQLAQKTLIQLIGDRDYSAQETMHLLMSFPQYRCSRTFVPLFLSGDRELIQEDGEPMIVSTLVDRYCKRPRAFDTLSLFDFYTAHSATGSKISARRRQAVVVPHGLGKVSRDSTHFEDYARKYLMVHVPFRNAASLRGNFASYSDAYDAAIQASNPHDGFDLTEEMLNADLGSEETGPRACMDNTNGAHNVPAEVADLLKVHPLFEANLKQADDFDWRQSYRDQPELFESARRFEGSVLIGARGSCSIDVSRLNAKQSVVYDEIAKHVLAKKVDKDTPALLKIVTGKAGTGKSFLIRCIKELLGERCLLIALTGIAACNVSGQTINSALRIPVVSSRSFCELKGQALEELQERLKDIEYIVVDEMSMIGAAKLCMIDRRLRQAFPGNSDCLFGGRSFVMIGDFGQLPPPGDTKLYTKRAKNKFEAAGLGAYRSFKSCTVLDTVVRQEADHRFRGLLERLRIGKVLRPDYDLLKTRFVSAMPAQREEFRDATRLFARRCDVNEYNVTKLCELGKPIAYIEGQHTCGTGAKKAQSDDAGGLEAYTMLAEGAKIMLTANLGVDVGLCNGAVGTVEKIVYRDGGHPGLPHLVLCRFPNYRGKEFMPGEPQLFPVVPLTRRFIANGVECTRTSLPLRLAWGLTIHKSQGLTLRKVVLCVGDREFATGLTFVGMSRVRRLTDMLNVPFAFSRIEKIGSTAKRACHNERKTAMELLREKDHRLLQLERGQNCSEIDDRPNISYLEIVEKRSTLSHVLDAHASMAIQEHNAGDNRRSLDVYVPFRPITDADRFKLAYRCGFDVSQRMVDYGKDKNIRCTAPPPALPGGIVNVAGDGSCFYYAISYALTNCPFYDGELRDLCDEYLEHHPDILPPGLHHETLQDIRNSSGWADPKVILTMAYALDCSIFVYQKQGEYAWVPYHPGNPSYRAIYLFHCDPTGAICRDREPNHFSLVLDVDTSRY